MPEYRELVETTTQVFSDAINYEISDGLRDYLEQDAFIFSGLKTHAQLSEARGYLKDSKGNITPYSQFEQRILKLNKKYNKNYLEAEYEFAVHSAQSAHNWQTFSDNTERYLLQYRTAGDDRVRVSHQSLNKTTLPKDNPFWNSYFPSLGWRCRCVVKQVLARKNTPSNSEEAMENGRKATTHIGKSGKNKLAMFRFNPGKNKKLFPPKNSYHPQNCNGAKLNITAMLGYSQIVLALESERCRAKKVVETEQHRRLREERKKADKEVKQWFNSKLGDKKYLSLKGEQFKHEVRIDKTSVREMLGHFKSPKAKLVVKDVETVLKKSIYQKGKDRPLDTNKPKRNLEKKRKRGVVAYRYYKSELKNYNVFISMEVNKRNYEQQ